MKSNRIPRRRMIALVLAALAVMFTAPRYRFDLESGWATALAVAEDSANKESKTDQEADEDVSETPWQPPEPAAASERVDERLRMVEDQIAHSLYGRKPVKNKQVLEAMRTVPRHVFVIARNRRHAYRDSPLPIDHGQTISQPYIVAAMTELLNLTPKSNVLEIGTGSAYQAAVLGQLTPHVYTIEILEPLAKQAQKVLKEQGYHKVQVRHGDGYYGWKEHAPFDAIIVTCAAGHLPPPLWEQLRPGGRIVVPIGRAFGSQRLTVVTKTAGGKHRSQHVMGVRFVPMKGRVSARPSRNEDSGE